MIGCVLLLLACSRNVFSAEARIQIRRVPGGGVQPQVQVDARGVVHLVYLSGDPSHADVSYSRSTDGGTKWSVPTRVNSQPGSALSIGTVRGAQMAVGRDGRVFVAWMGSSTAEPKAPGGLVPMLFSRLSANGKSFEPQRNLIASHPGLDGGGSVAADREGNVFVAWHAPAVAKGTEQDRRVWIARSIDDGKTFAPEIPLSSSDSGACGCCGMRISAGDGKVVALYRGAAEQINRGMRLIETSTDLRHPRDRQIDPMKFGACIMSTAAFGWNANNVLMAWETKGQVLWSPVADDAVHPHSVPGNGNDRKHPALACDHEGNVLLAWTEGTGWNKGGSLAWQLFDASGNAIPNSAGQRRDLPAWDSPAAFCGSDRSFTVLY